MQKASSRISSHDLTDHAMVRAQQRGVTHDVISLVLSEFDISLHAGEGRLNVRISRLWLAELVRSGTSARLAERAAGVVLVIDPVSSLVITVLHDHGDRAGRCYRRQMPTRSARRRWRRSPAAAPTSVRPRPRQSSAN